MSAIVLEPAQAAFLDAARRAILATIDPEGRPRVVPVCFVRGSAGNPDRIYTPLDEKPKRVGDPLRLARVRDIRARPAVTLLVDRWEEDWARLAWLRLSGEAEILEPGDGAGEHRRAAASLRERYPQYRNHDLESRPMIAVTIIAVVGWGDLG